MKKVFNEDLREDICLNVMRGIEQSDYFNHEFTAWMNRYNNLASYGLRSNANNYFTNLNKTLIATSSSVTQIFCAASEVERNYAKKFEDIAFEMSMYADRIEMLRNFLKPAVINTGLTALNFPDFGDWLNRVIVNQVKKDTELLVKYYTDPPDRWEKYIEVQMKRSPEDITYAEYLTMISIFEGLTNEKREKFIEMAFFLQEQPETFGRKSYDFYELSSVFTALAIIAQQSVPDLTKDMLRYDDQTKNDSPIHNKLFCSLLLLNIALFCQEVHIYIPQDIIDETKIIVEIERCTGSGTLSYDHKVTIIGYPSIDSISNELLSFTMHQFRHSVAGILEDNVLSIASSMIPNARIEILKTIFETAIGEIPGLGSVGFIFAGFDILNAIKDEIEARDKVDKISESLFFANLSDAAKFGATLTIMPDGSFMHGNITFDSDALKKCLNVYNEEKKKILGDDFVALTVDFVVDIITSGDLNEDLKNYVDWYKKEDGQDKCGY